MHCTFILYAYSYHCWRQREDIYRLLSGLDHWIWKPSSTRKWNLVREFEFIYLVQLM